MIDPRDPALAAVTAPVHARALIDADRIASAMVARCGELEAAGLRLEPLRVEDDRGGASLARVAVQERLRKRADDDRDMQLVLPRTIVPPLDVARMERVVGGAAIRFVAVDEVEPVSPAGPVARDAVDRLDEAAAVARLHLHRVLKRLHRSLSCPDLADEQHMLPAVAGDPERRAPLGVGRAAAREGGNREPGGRQASHRPLYVRERIAPVFATRTE